MLAILSNDDDIILTKNRQFLEEIFDSYYINVNSTIKDILISEINEKGQKIISDNDIKLPN